MNPPLAERRNMTSPIHFRSPPLFPFHPLSEQLQQDHPKRKEWHCCNLFCGILAHYNVVYLVAHIRTTPRGTSTKTRIEIRDRQITEYNNIIDKFSKIDDRSSIRNRCSYCRCRFQNRYAARIFHRGFIESNGMPHKSVDDLML